MRKLEHWPQASEMQHKIWDAVQTLCPPELIFLSSFHLWSISVHHATYSLQRSASLSPQTKTWQHLFKGSLWTGNSQSVKPQITNISLNPKSRLPWCICIPFMPLLVFHQSPLCLFLPNLPFLSLSSLPSRPTFNPCLSHSVSPFCPLPNFLPSFHFPSLHPTVPEGRGHLRTKWRINRQLCAHSLRWPSIIHSLLPPLPSLHLRSACFISPCRQCRYLLPFHTKIACLSFSVPVILSFKPFLLLQKSTLDSYSTLAHSFNHHFTASARSYSTPLTNPFIPSVSSCLPLFHVFPTRLMTLRHKASGPV